MTKTDILERRKQFSDVTYHAVILRIEMPDGSVETIVNHNVDSKIEYICNAYTEELVHKNNDRIKIVGFTITGDRLLSSFGTALQHIQSNLKMARLDWDDEEYIYFVKAQEDTVIPNDKNDAKGTINTVVFKEYAVKKESDGTARPYIPSYDDMFSHDWIEYKFKKLVKTGRATLADEDMV